MFERLRGERFLPFDQIDEDPSRAALDRALLVEVLGLPAALCAEDGPLALLRRKLAAEPQIHGGKGTRVVFTERGERNVSRAGGGARGRARTGVLPRAMLLRYPSGEEEHDDGNGERTEGSGGEGA